MARMTTRRLPLPVIVVSMLFIGPQTVLAGAFTADPLVQVSGSSPFTSCTADGVGGQPGTNFANSEVEPWVDINPTASTNIVGVFQQDRWSNGGSRGLVARFSTNGGTSWTESVIPNITLCSGGNTSNGGDFKRATDPWLSFAPNGDLYTFSLSLDPNPATGGFGKTAMLVSKSTDGGQTWGDPITVIRDEDPRFLNDKNSITADPSDSDFVYAVWDRLVLSSGSVKPPSSENAAGFGFDSPAYFSRTTDGGQTWEPARKIYDPGRNNQTIGNQIVVRPDGTLVDGFMEFLNARNDEGGGHQSQWFSLITSTDRGATWSHGRPNRVSRITNVGVRDPDDASKEVRTGDFIPDLAVDPNNGNLYAVWQDGRFSAGQVNGIAFTMSTDGGRTWSTPIKVNQTPTSIPTPDQNAFTASVAVAADGTIGVGYYDFRNNTSSIGLDTDYWLVHCHGAVADCTSASNWGSEARVTGTSFNMESAPPTERGFFLGDYEGLATDGNDFLTFFSKPHDSDPASVFFGRVGP